MSVINFKPPKPEDYEKYGIKREDLIWMWTTMLRIRRFEERVMELFLKEKKLRGPAHLYIGEEAIATGVAKSLREDDWVVSTYRGHGHAIARGVPMKYVMAEIFGRITGTCKGIGGSMHAAMYPEKGIVYATAIVGSGIPIAAGIALGFQYLETDRVAVVFFGDGATNTGAFHEGINIAALWKLPLILICENNFYAMGTHISRSVAGGSIAKRACAYGINGIVVDGNDPVAVYLAVEKAIEGARNGRGPTLIEAITYRLVGHGVYDTGEKYRSKEEVEEWRKREPISRFRDLLLSFNFASEDELSAIDDEVRREIDEAVEFAENSPYLDFSELYRFVYA